jgi:hypothetical protein
MFNSNPDYGGKNKEDLKTIPMEVVQDTPRNGLRTLRLSRRQDYPHSQKQHIIRKVLPIEWIDPGSSEYWESEFALKYLLKCESISENFSQTENSSSDQRDEKISLKPINNNKFAYKQNPPIFEHTFVYSYCDYPLYGAFSRVQLSSDSGLLAATIVSPIDRDFEGLSCHPQKTIEDIFKKVKELANYGNDPIPAESEKPPTIKWYFDPACSGWRLAYIVDGIVKRARKNDCKQENDKINEKGSNFSPIEVVDYIIDATTGAFITEIRLNR